MSSSSNNGKDKKSWLPWNNNNNNNNKEDQDNDNHNTKNNFFNEETEDNTSHGTSGMGGGETSRTTSLDDNEHNDDDDDDRSCNNSNEDAMIEADHEFARQLQEYEEQQYSEQQQQQQHEHYNDDDYDDESLGLVAHYEAQSIAELLQIVSHQQQEDELLASGNENLHPDLQRRIRDFRFAQHKRKEKYGKERPWGILGLYDHLACIRIDLEWAEDAAWRRQHDEPYLSWSDFDGARKKGVNRPFFTYILLLICTVTLVVSIGLNGWSVEPLKVNPMIGPSAETLVDMGAKETNLIVNENEWFRLFSPMILHAGIIHFVLNMMALWFIGSAIEQSHGFINAATLFVVPAVGGTILSAIFLPQYISVGASGGIFGLIGACIADITLNWNLLFIKDEDGKRRSYCGVLVVFLLDIIVNCLIGLTPFVDNFTHLGGMVLGFLCGLSTMERLPSDFFGIDESCYIKTKQLTIRFFGLIISVISIAVTLVILLEGDGVTSSCPNCTWLSCVPMPPWADETNRWWYCDDCHTRTTAEIIMTDPNNLYLQLDCPSSGGKTVKVPLDNSTYYYNNNDNSINTTTIIDSETKSRLEKDLPSYCREYCFGDTPNDNNNRDVRRDLL